MIYKELLLQLMLFMKIKEVLLQLKNGRVGLWQGDKRQAKYLGNTVSSNVETFYKDYLHGKWYNTPDKKRYTDKYYLLINFI